MVQNIAIFWVRSQLGADGHPPQPEPLAEALAALPLAIAADGVTVPFRPEAGTAKGKIIWREVKVALPSRLSTQVNRAGQSFTRLRHQLRHGYVHRIIKELGALLRYSSTPPSAQVILRRVRNYLKNHFSHLQYRLFKKQGLPIGSGMVESACKWLITQRFKGVGIGGVNLASTICFTCA